MRILLANSTNEAISTVTTILMDRITAHPKSVIGLATGKTMEPVYAGWIEELKKTSTKLDKCFFFMLDEYLNIPDNHPSSFKRYIHDRLITPMDLKDSQIAYPPIHLGEAGGAHYEQLIKEAGGIDLQLLGIGTNGHIGFNEPGSYGSTRTRIVNLTEETREANKSSFVGGDVPAQALSMGVASIMESKEIVLLATGKSKASAIKYLLNHHDDNTCPVTYLKAHPHFVLVLDPDAASNISLKI